MFNMPLQEKKAVFFLLVREQEFNQFAFQFKYPRYPLLLSLLSGKLQTVRKKKYCMNYFLLSIDQNTLYSLA